MKPKYYFFSNDFIHFFMKYTQLHNTQFKSGSEFKKLIENYEPDSIQLFNTFFASYAYDGLFLFSREETELHGFVLDVDNIRDKNRYDDNVLLIIEKFFRIYIKIDQNYPLSSNEIHINGTTCYIVNPFSYSPNMGGFIKYIINTSPEQKRNEVRGIKLFLNTIDGVGQLDYTNFKKANYHRVIEKFPSVRNAALAVEGEKRATLLSDATVFEFEEEKKLDSITNYIGFSKWKNYLTEHQKRIVYSDNMGPLKIVGPAGTGKTLSLILKALYLAKKYASKKQRLRIGFICHSEAMRQSIESILSIDGAEFLDDEADVSISITTLMKWCCDYAVKDFSLEDCLEVDSFDSKLMQQMMIENAVEKFMQTHLKTFREFLSPKFLKYLETTPRPSIVENIRSEISIFIKGPNVETLDGYKNSRSKGKILPLEKDEDFAAIYQIYELYQRGLTDINKYDIDDVTSVALVFLSRAIWRRNRKINGYDVVFVDELHLYDFSEISILKYMLRDENENHIISAMDMSQSSGDMEIIQRNINYLNNTSASTNDLGVVFRSSQSIISLTKYLFDSKLSLFASVNPLQNVSVLQGAEEVLPSVVYAPSDEQMVNVLMQADVLKRQERKNLLVIFTDYALENLLISNLEKNHIPHIVLRTRNDYSAMKIAREESKLVIGYIDFVGGLEFDNVYIIGFDLGRVPPVDNSMSVDFFTHVWYRKIYVAFTRAKKNLLIYSNIANGLHPFLKDAVETKLLSIGDL